MTEISIGVMDATPEEAWIASYLPVICSVEELLLDLKRSKPKAGGPKLRHPIPTISAAAPGPDDYIQPEAR